MQNELNEENHIKFWEKCLNDLIKQFKILNELLDMTKKLKIQRFSELSELLMKFRNDSKQFTKEPSHIYYLCEIYFDFQSFCGEVINKSTNKLYDQINSMSLEVIKDIENTRNETNKNNFIIMDELKNLIQKIKTQENEFNKIKSSMDNAQINQNKIKNKVQYTYNIAELQKADLILAEQIRKMEEIKIPMDENKKKLIELRDKLNSSIRDSFEKVFSIYFKHLANLHQYFFLLENNKLEVVSNVKKKFGSSLLQLSNLSFDLNDYTEKKFGELIGIKYDGIIMFNSEELLNKSSSNLLLKISYDVINYIQVFMICLRYRKKIMKIFYDVIKAIEKNEETYIKNSDISYQNLINQINLIKNISNGISKSWNKLFIDVKSKIVDYHNIILSGIDNYINYSRNEYNQFKLNWDKYENKIKERQKITIELLKEKNEDKGINKNNSKIKDDALREIIKQSIKFINENVYKIRERDKKEMARLSSIFEKLFQKFKSSINKIIDITEEELSDSATLDIFEECKIIIIKYFNNFKIQNYENFLEKMKIKLLLNTELQEQKMIKDAFEKLNYNLEEKEEINGQISDFDDSQSQILPENEDNISEVKKINNLFFEPKKNLSQNVLFDNDNNNDKKINLKNNKISFDKITFNKNEKNGNLLNENNLELDNIKDVENGIYEKQEEDSFDLLDKNKFTELTKIENPYKNIKEEELKRLKLMSQNKNINYNELEEGEKKIDSFNCALKDKILLQGKLNITNKKIEFTSLFNPVTLFGKTVIIIPFKDIIEIEKKYNLGLDNSINIKTEKISYLFTNFLSRDRCYNLLQKQMNQIKEKELTKNKTIEIKEKPLNQKEIYLRKKRIKSKQILYMLEDINFYDRINQATKDRMKIFQKKYRDEKKGTFLSDDKFTNKIFEHIFKSCPLYICFKYICNLSTQLDELGYSKGFFESILIEIISKEIIMIEKEENSNIPEYFDNGDYVMDLFCSFNKDEINDFLNSIHKWAHKYEYDCYGMNKNKSKKNEKPDLFVVYFISPTLLIFDVIRYSSELIYNFIPIIRYRFDSSIKFNKYKGKFDFTTKLTVMLGLIFQSNFILTDNITNKAISNHEEIFKNHISNKLINIVDSYIEIFTDISEKMVEEIFEKKIRAKQNMITGELEDDNIDDISSEEDENSQINISFNRNSEINFKENIKATENENEGNSKTNNEDIIYDKKNEEKFNFDKNINNSNNTSRSKSKKLDKDYKIFIIIIIMLIGIIISLLFFKSDKPKIDFNIITNLIILGVVVYLLKYKD